MKKYILLLIALSGLLVNTIFVNASNRVIYNFTQYSDTSGEIELNWKENNNNNIQIISYYMTKDNVLEVSYRVGNDVPSGFDDIAINGVHFPVRIIIKEQNVENNILTDLPDNKIDRYDILNLYHRGIINGYSDNSFRPENKVTRAEFFAMLVDTAGYNINTDSQSIFSDVDDNFWGKKYIMTLANKGVVSGDGNGLCNPNGEITIGEILAIIDRTFIFHNQTANYKEPTVEHWSNENFINTAKANIVNDIDVFYSPYTPDIEATRQQCATLLSRVLQTNYSLK